MDSSLNLFNLRVISSVKYIFKQGIAQNVVRKLGGETIVNEEWVKSWDEASEASKKAYMVKAEAEE